VTISLEIKLFIDSEFQDTFKFLLWLSGYQEPSSLSFASIPPPNTSQKDEKHNFNVNIDDLTKYCQERGIKNDGKARSQFVAKRN
jgi:hypothetical protein